MSDPSRREVLLAAGALGLSACGSAEGPPTPAAPAPAEEPEPPPDPHVPRPHGGPSRNLVVILVDDQRADGLGLAGHPFLVTPRLDAMGREGAWCRNAFVTTSLCCPSRASLLTGLYAHSHGVLNNQTPLPRHLATWNGIVKRAGYTTAYVGKWHMGGRDATPRPDWDHWVSFPGQGRYHYPGKEGAPEDRQFNVNGTLEAVEGYVTDLVTDRAIDWLQTRKPGERFAMVVGHKACHAPFDPAPRHADAFAEVTAPEPLPDTEAAYAGRPHWLRRMRESLFGVERLYNGRWKTFDEWYRDYHRTLLAVDEGVGRILDALRELGLAEETLVVYTSDNGFMHGERGVLDKRCAYEESIRVPILAWGPGLVKPETRLDKLVLNVDIPSTLLDAAGLDPPESWHGRSFLPLLRGEEVDWRDAFLYEYFFERAFPQCPTVLAVRTEKAKLISYHGAWEDPEFFDLEADPGELTNLVRDASWVKRRKMLWKRLRGQLGRVGGRWQPSWELSDCDAG